jgi:hypothetical protein
MVPPGQKSLLTGDQEDNHQSLFANAQQWLLETPNSRCSFSATARSLCQRSLTPNLWRSSTVRSLFPGMASLQRSLSSISARCPIQAVVHISTLEQLPTQIVNKPAPPKIPTHVKRLCSQDQARTAQKLLRACSASNTGATAVCFRVTRITFDMSVKKVGRAQRRVCFVERSSHDAATATSMSHKRSAGRSLRFGRRDSIRDDDRCSSRVSLGQGLCKTVLFV